MWNASNQCKYKPDISELKLAELKGINTLDALLEVRRAKTNITKILVLDAYASWVIENYKNKEKYDKRLKVKTIVRFNRERSKLNSEVFDRIGGYHFYRMCQSKTFAKFQKDKPEIRKHNLSSLIGLRETALNAVAKAGDKITRRGKYRKPKKVDSNEN
jgi:hypothetical protein